MNKIENLQLFWESTTLFGRRDSSTDTVVHLLAAQLRRDISIGALAPDTKLKVGDLCVRYGGSANSFREALTQLANEGLVEANPQRGFRVASATQDDLKDITRVRAEIEMLGLDWAIQHGDLAWEGRILAAYHSFSRLCALAQQDPTSYAIEWDEAAGVFHAALVSASDSPRLIGFQRLLFLQSRRFRYAALVEGRIDLGRALGELKVVVDATLERDGATARKLLGAYILREVGEETAAH